MKTYRTLFLASILLMVIAASAYAQDKQHDTIKPWPSAAFKVLTPGVETYTIEDGVNPFTDPDFVMGNIAPHLVGLTGMRFSYATAKEGGISQIEFEVASPVKVLVGYAQDSSYRKWKAWLEAPSSEQERHAYDREWIVLEDVADIRDRYRSCPILDVHAFHYEAGKHTLDAGKGLYVILGVVPADGNLEGAKEWKSFRKNSRDALRPNFEVAETVSISVPDKAIEESFQIAKELVAEMRQIAYDYYRKDGWLGTSNGNKQPQYSYDLRDFRYGVKCGAYLWGDDMLLRTMGERIFFDQHDEAGKLTWDLKDQCPIHVAQNAKHFSDYLRHSEQDEFIQQNWQRQLDILKWSLATYDRNDDGLIEQGEQLTIRIWGLLVGEPRNGFVYDNTQDDVVVVASMEICEWLQLLAAYAEANNMPETDWLKTKAETARKVIEDRAYNEDADYYYLLYRAVEKRWYHSGRGIDESSREFDVTPYYSALISGNDERGRKVAEHARYVLMERNIFPMPLVYPGYDFVVEIDGEQHGSFRKDRFVAGGCWEESYYNCVRSWSKYAMFDAVYAAIKRRSDAHVRDQDCVEWYAQDGAKHGPRDRYGISAGAHVAAIIEGLFGITPKQFGFDDVTIWPAIPADWAGKPASISVALPGNGFLKYTYLFNQEKQTITIMIETNKRRQGHFRIPVPTLPKQITFNGHPFEWSNIGESSDGRTQVAFTAPFEKASIEVVLN